MCSDVNTSSYIFSSVRIVCICIYQYIQVIHLCIRTTQPNSNASFRDGMQKANICVYIYNIVLYVNSTWYVYMCIIYYILYIIYNIYVLFLAQVQRSTLLL